MLFGRGLDVIVVGRIVCLDGCGLGEGRGSRDTPGGGVPCSYREQIQKHFE